MTAISWLPLAGARVHTMASAGQTAICTGDNRRELI